MAIISVQLIGRGKRRATSDDVFLYEQVDSYRVITDDDQDTPVLWDDDDTEYPDGNDPANYYSIPQVSEQHPDAAAIDPDTNLLLRRKRYTEDAKDPRRWQLDCEYSTASADPALQAADPLDCPPIVNYGLEVVKVAVQSDLDGEPIVNSAGDPYDAQTIDDTVTVITIDVNQGYFTAAEQQTYNLSTNLMPIWGYPNRAVLCSSYTGKRSYRNGVEYYAKTMQFKIMGPVMAAITGSDWTKLMLVDQGLRQWNSDLGAAVPITDAQTRKPVTKPVLLNGEGLAQDVDKSELKLYFNTYTVKNLVDWGPLNLPVAV